MGKLARSFYERPTLEVARDLLGKYLIFNDFVGRIVETEGYLGPEDLASHARFKSKKRNFPMFGSAGTAYVYMTYGMYFMLNVITETKDVPGGVLIRALEPQDSNSANLNGPGRLTKAFGITLLQNGTNLTTNDSFFLEDRGGNMEEVVEATRIGISYAGEYANKPWRFFIKNNPYVSKS